MKIPPLTPNELKLLLNVLRAANPDPREKFSKGQLWALETGVRNYVKNSRGRVIINPRELIWGEKGKTPETFLRGRWSEAGSRFLGSIVSHRDKLGFYCPMPAIGLPSHTPAVFVHNRDQFVDWFVARAVANRQWLRFVKCQDCHKVGLRHRGKKESKYCNEDCQKKASLAQLLRKDRDTGDFETFLAKDGGRSPRFELELANIQRSKKSLTNAPAIEHTSVKAEKIGGTLAGGQKLLYVVSAIDKNGIPQHSKPIRVSISSDTDTNQITLSGPSLFDKNAVRYQVWRVIVGKGEKRIPISNPEKVRGANLEFVDSGLISVQRRTAYNALTVKEIPEYCPSCIIDGVAQPLVFAKRLKSIAGDFNDAWHCLKCGQVVRKGSAIFPKKRK